MMSELSLAEDFLKLINFSSKLALSFHELTAKIPSAPRDVGHLARDLTSFSAVSQQVEVVLKDDSSYSLAAEALQVLGKPAARIQERLGDV